MQLIPVSTYRQKAGNRGLIDKIEASALTVIMVFCWLPGLAGGALLGAALGPLVGRLAGAFVAFALVLSLLGAAAGGGMELMLRRSSSHRPAQKVRATTVVATVLGALLALLTAVDIGVGGEAVVHVLAGVALCGLGIAVAVIVVGGVVGILEEGGVDSIDHLLSFGVGVARTLRVAAVLAAVGGAALGVWIGFPSPDVARFSTFTTAVFEIAFGGVGSASGLGVGYLLAKSLNAYFNTLSERRPLLVHLAVVILPGTHRARYREEWHREWTECSAWRRLPFLLDLLLRGAPQMAITLRRGKKNDSKRHGGPGHGGLIR